MNTDEQFENYFKSRSRDITLSGTPTADIMSRGRRRRQRRKAVRIGALVGVFSLAGITAAQTLRANDEPRQQVAANSPDPLDWTMVRPPTGISHSMSSIEVGDSMYSLSSSPGVSTSAGRFALRTLYRSADGTAWQQVSVPAGYSLNDLATDGDRVYAVGTSPSGGGAVIASSADGSWSTHDLPLDLAAASEAAGAPLEVSNSQIAVSGTTTVVTVRVHTKIGKFQLPIPSEVKDVMSSTAITSEGVTYSCPEGADPVTECGGVTSKFYTWEQLGVTEAAGQAYTGIRLRYVSTDGEPFVEVDRSQGTDGVLGVGDDGFWSVSRTGSEVTVEHSVDGKSWNPVVAPLLAAGPDEIPESAGTFQGRAVFVVRPGTVRGPLTVWQAGTDGGIASSFDPGADGAVSSVAVGPLGFAGINIVQPADGSAPMTYEAVYSPDLQNFTSTPIENLERRTGAAGVRVSADAVTYTLVDRSDVPVNDETKSGKLLLFVGTPR